MSYRHRSATMRTRLPVLLVILGFSVVVVGFICTMFAMYLVSVAGSLTGPGGQGAFAGMLLEPLAALFRAGVTTAGGGFALVIGGGFTVFVARG